MTGDENHFEDITTGINYVINNYNYVDKDKICAAGGYYGGYMINLLTGILICLNA